MRTTLGRLRAILREEYDPEKYAPQLDKIVAKHAAPHIYLRFDDRESFSKARSFRFDLNPNQHSNHAGLWTYMIEPGSDALHNATFGSSSRWVTILRAKDPRRMVRSDEYTSDDLARDIKQLTKTYPVDAIKDALRKRSELNAQRLEQAEEFKDEHPEIYADMVASYTGAPHPFENLDWLASYFGKDDVRTRYRQFYTSLGYKGIEDPLGIIDTNGWTAVHFDPGNVKIVKRYRLEHASEPEEQDKRDEEYWAQRRLPDDFDPMNPNNDPGEPTHEPGWYYAVGGERKRDPRLPRDA